MNLREKIKSYSFWVSLASAVILILKVLGSRFGFQVDETMISDLFTALCSILVLLGIIVVPQQKQTTNFSQENNLIQEVSCNESTVQTESTEEVNAVETQPIEEVLNIDTVEVIDYQEPVVQNEIEIEDTTVCAESNLVEVSQTESIQTENQLQNDLNSFLAEPISSNESLKDYLSIEKSKYAVAPILPTSTNIARAIRMICFFFHFFMFHSQHGKLFIHEKFFAFFKINNCSAAHDQSCNDPRQRLTGRRSGGDSKLESFWG